MTLNSIWKIKPYEYPGQLQQRKMADWPYKRMKQYKIEIFKKVFDLRIESPIGKPSGKLTYSTVHIIEILHLAVVYFKFVGTQWLI